MSEDIPEAGTDRDRRNEAKSSGDYDVGYGKPPREHQWKKGQSGNPAGSERGKRSLKAVLRDEMFESIEITENGKKRKLTKLELTVKAWVAKAAKGDTRAAERVLRMFMEIFGIEDERESKKGLSDADAAILKRFLGDSDDIDGSNPVA